MPIIKFKHLISFSSEDPKHAAENILKPQTYYKWRCASAGERQASLLIQLEKARQIQSVDVGNNGSAFVEILVGRSSWSPSEEFKEKGTSQNVDIKNQVLLVASSFMSPSESKAGKEVNRVRMFGIESLNKTVADEKWDQVKIVCTQPYNQNEPYGLSFLRLHSPDKAVESEEKKTSNKYSTTGSAEEASYYVVPQLGRFKLKSNSDDESDSISSTSFFEKRMHGGVTTQKQPEVFSIAASARKSSTSGETPVKTIFKTHGEHSSSPKQITVSNDKRNEVASNLLQGSEKSASRNSPFPKMPDKPKKITVVKTPKRSAEAPTKRKVSTDTDLSSSNTPAAKKLKAGKKRSKLKRKNVPYNKIMDGVTFALSGYQNPERGNIRDEALRMGAKYSQNWNPQCTHLICAFANTPKFHQVRGKGKILTKNWIYECSRSKRRVNTKGFRIDGGGDSTFESSSDEEEREENQSQAKEDSSTLTTASHISSDNRRKIPSECDTDDELEKIREMNQNSEASKADDHPEETSPVQSVKKPEQSTIKKDDEKDDLYGGTTDEESEATATSTSKVLEKEKKEDKAEDRYDGTTEEEDNNTDIAGVSSSDVTEQMDISINELPEFFEDLVFFFYKDFDIKDRRLLRRYITAYSGTLEEYMGDAVKFVISNEEWDCNFDQALKDNPSLVFVRPKWIFKCHEKQKLIPYAPYEIKP